MNFSEAAALPISKLLPHAGPMSLLDRCVSLDAEGCEAELTIRPDSTFCDGEKVGSWVGLEYMAQAIAASAGAAARVAGQAPKSGMLLGSREYRVSKPHFRVGSVLRIHVKKGVGNSSGLSLFDCRLSEGSEILATASIMVQEINKESV